MNAPTQATKYNGFLTNPDKLYTRYLKIEITLNQGSFGDYTGPVQAQNNTLVINDTAPVGAVNPVSLNARVAINESLSQQMDQSADITIHGLDTSAITQISMVGQYSGNGKFANQLNIIRIYAGYDPANSQLIYTGQITQAYADFNDPNRPLHLNCTTNAMMQLANASATNPQGNVSVDQLFQTLASTLGLGYVSTGVGGSIKNPILTGSAIDQIKALAKATGTTPMLKNNILSVAPLGQPHSQLVIDLDYTTGLMGYPTVTKYGVAFKMRFNPLFQVGQYINLTSYVPKTTGTWWCYAANSVLDNNQEEWYTLVQCAPNPTGVPQS